MNLKTQLIINFSLSEDQADKLLDVYDKDLIAKAIKLSVFKNKEILRMNIKILLKHSV